MSSDCERCTALLSRLEQHNGQNHIGAAELAVGQFVYRRIEKLMDARAGTPEGAELSYLAEIVSDVEEYGARGDEDQADRLEQHNAVSDGE